MTRGRLWALLIAATIASAWLTATRLRVSGDVAPLFPDGAASAALARFVRAFGGGDAAILLVRGTDAPEVAEATDELARALEARRSVEAVVVRAPEPLARALDPTLAWRFAGPGARASLARAVTPEGMRERLRQTRDLLLAPGASEVETWLASDPLRLTQIPFESRPELAAGVVPAPDGTFTADGGRARLIVIRARGNAFDESASAAFVGDVGDAVQTVTARHPTVHADLTGGHAIAYATKQMLVRDLAVSGTLSLVLASAVFLVTFRRARAVAAVIPPLLLGTLWTTGIAAFVPGGLNAIAIAFAAVVVGVGVDTGVHVYAALLDGRRAGLDPPAAARFARRHAGRPTMLAAVTAGAAFASLGLSELSALRQLGLLCAAGEVLTAAEGLSKQSEALTHEVINFVSAVRAA